MRIISIIQDQIISLFLDYLKTAGLSENSIRFYKSDLSRFRTWVINENRKLGIYSESFKDTVPFLKTGTSHEYKAYLIKSASSPKTINRQLSTLRRFSDFLRESGTLSFDLTRELENVADSSCRKLSRESEKISTLIADFQKHLEGKNASKNTIKNYIADVRHFFTWIDIYHA
jgi:site-specific recombinase XerD